MVIIEVKVTVNMRVKLYVVVLMVVVKMNFFYLKRVAMMMVNLLIRNKRQMRREKFVISAKGKC